MVNLLAVPNPVPIAADSGNTRARPVGYQPVLIGGYSYAPEVDSPFPGHKDAMASTASAKGFLRPRRERRRHRQALLYETAAAFSDSERIRLQFGRHCSTARARHTSFAKLLEIHAESHAKLTQSLAAQQDLKEHLAGNARAWAYSPPQRCVGGAEAGFRRTATGLRTQTHCPPRLSTAGPRSIKNRCSSSEAG